MPTKLNKKQSLFEVHTHKETTMETPIKLKKEKRKKEKTPKEIYFEKC